MQVSDDTIESVRNELVMACQTLSGLQLCQAAKWCAEAVNGLPKRPQSSDIPAVSLTDEERVDFDKLMLARTYFNVKEFNRCAYVLSECKSSTAVFLKLYSTLLAVDKKEVEETDGAINLFHLPEDKDSNVHNGSGPNGGPVLTQSASGSDVNTRLTKIVQEIEAYHSSHEPDAHLYYLMGCIYNKKKSRSLAQQNFFNSLRLFPYNWSCWQEFIHTLSSFEEALEVINKIRSSKSSLAEHYMFHFFEVVIMQEFYQKPSTSNETLSGLLTVFPEFSFLKVQKFLMCYHSLDYHQAELIFDKVLIDDPLRLDDLDTYSNMLYVMEKRSKLSFLAQYSSSIDKFRPETSCIIANYHSMKGEHEKAIMHYKRALILNKNCLSAWTLMGHEFVELKNSHAAIESYRRAVDINPKDFRAWYGLGQAYEVLDMHLYSLYYYQRATNLQPLDKRMWQAIGNCYEKINKYEECIKSFEKALSIDNYNRTNASSGNESHNEHTSSFDPYICYKLAMISEKLDKMKDCYKYMKLCFDQEYEWGITDETSKARLWLARYALETKRYEEAYGLTKDLNHNNAHDIEEARAIAREARNRINK